MKRGREAVDDRLKDVIKNVINLCNNGVVEKKWRKMGMDDDTLLIEDQVLPEVFALIKQHKIHLNLK